MFEFNYKDFFSFRIKHHFYSSSRCPDFEIVPTPESKALMQRADMLYKIRPDGLDVRYNTNREEILNLLVRENPAAKLSFACYVKNPLFFNFTELPVEFKGYGLIWDNLTPHQDKDAKLSWCISPKNTINELDLLPSWHKLFEEKYADSPHEVLAEHLQSSEKQLLHWEGVNMPAFAPPQYGVYEVFVDAQKKGNYLYTWTDRAALPFAYLEIHLAKGQKPIFMDGRVQPIQYEVCFEARTSYWRYLILPRHLKDFAKLLVLGERENKELFEFKDKRLVAGQEAHCFEAKKPLPMTERAQYNFQLQKLQTGGLPKIVLDKLPVASFQNLKPNGREKNSKIFSEIFVHV